MGTNQFCTNCGRSTSPEWKYCKYCGAPLVQLKPTFTINSVSYQPVVHKSTEKKHNYSSLIVIMLLLALGVFAAIYFGAPNPQQGVNTTNPSSTASAQSPKPSPVSIKSGTILSKSGYKGVCPLTVSVPSGKNNYFIYLDYIGEPSYTTEQRTKLSDTQSKEDDVAFYVVAGDSVDIDVPIGKYKLYYACGETWYGLKYKFGESTLYYSSNDLLSFYSDREYYNGHTLELWLQSNGNLDRKEINEKQFPG